MSIRTCRSADSSTQALGANTDAPASRCTRSSSPSAFSCKKNPAAADVFRPAGEHESIRVNKTNRGVDPGSPAHHRRTKPLAQPLLQPGTPGRERMDETDHSFVAEPTRQEGSALLEGARFDADGQSF